MGENGLYLHVLNGLMHNRCQYIVTHIVQCGIITIRRATNGLKREKPGEEGSGVVWWQNVTLWWGRSLPPKNAT